MTFLLDLLINVAANFIFWIGLGLVVAAYAYVSQRRFIRFFGLSKSATLNACVSNTWSSETSSRPRGYMISLHELRASEAINRLFGTAAFRLPDIVRGLVDALYVRSQRYTFHTVVSPTLEDGANTLAERNNSLIVIGAASKNSVRREYVERGMVTTRLSNERPDAGTHQLAREDRYAEIVLGPEAGQAFNVPGMTVVIVEKIRDHERGTVVMFCVGQRGDSTWAATEYLVRSWRRLEREFEDQPFSICLAFPDLNYSYTYVEPQRLR